MNRLLVVEPGWFVLRYGLYGQLRFLSEHGFEIAIASADDGRARAVASEIGAEFYPIDISAEPSWRQDLIAARRLFKLVRRWRPDCLQCSTKKAGFLGCLVGRLNRIPTAYLVRGLIRGGSESASPLRAFRIIEKINAHLASRVVVISDSSRLYFQKSGICSPHKLVMFGSGSIAGVDTKKFQQNATTMKLGRTLRRDLNIPEDAFVVGFVGRLVREKGIRELASAWCLARIGNERLHLLVVGPPEVDPRVESDVERLREDRRVHFSGFMADPVAAYSAMNCLVLPSYSEGFPSVLIEAACLGVPAIATTVTGCIDAVIDNETGWLIAPRDDQAIAKALVQAFENPHLVRRLGECAKMRATTQFQQEQIWGGYARLYDQLACRA